MGKQSGLGDAFYVGAYDLSGDVNAIGKISCPRDVFDFTSIKDSGYERQYGLRGGEIGFTSFFRGNGDWTPALAGSAGLSALPTADEIATYFRGQALQNPAASVNGKQLNYDPTRGNEGSLTLAITVQGNAYGLEWGEQLTAGARTDSAATTGPVITDAAQTTFGAQAYVHLLAFTGTSVTIEIQHATTSGGTYTNLMATTAMTAAGAQRLSVSNITTVDQYLKVTTVGTFSNAVFSVNFIRNLEAGVVF